jgi:hypothetical protein
MDKVNAYKINIPQNDPNFLTHVTWSKTSLVVQHIYLKFIWNLSCAFSKQNKHNSRINIYVNYKIVINYADLAGMGKHFYKTIYIITLCNFWHRI